MSDDYIPWWVVSDPNHPANRRRAGLEPVAAEHAEVEPNEVSAGDGGKAEIG